ncbi:hypothetical protein RclHR1_02610026 [Rhizophagus clarus]|uniref:Uncharacterized protein n=1 Tax=Rhizophagus clarus TaxID=94130 RepID=A0A2Z6RDY2_9GLOM|nr:hypothetical protein RclHR1_02610026 [Rhizophagus clarus]GES81191.1 hypothetical protein RCL_e11369_RclHR1_02610026 [Rhizophagus clarus]
MFIWERGKQNYNFPLHTKQEPISWGRFREKIGGHSITKFDRSSTMDSWARDAIKVKMVYERLFMLAGPW